MLTQRNDTAANKYVKVINGITFIDAIALEKSVDKAIPAKDHLKQKMINAGVEFWDAANTIVKKPVVGISAIGGFSISLEGDLPPEEINLRMGMMNVGPLPIFAIVNGLRDTMGMQSSHTFMNPNSKSARELYDTTVKFGHASIAHAAALGIVILGLSHKAELELDVQRDLVHLARETSARSICQDEPTLVAMTEKGAEVSATILRNITAQLNELKKEGNALDWREERNSLYPLSAAASLGINATVRNLMKLLYDIKSDGKELEYRNILALINDSLHGLFPELFKSTKELGHAYPAAWEKQKLPSIFALKGTSLFAEPQAKTPTSKRAILLLGAPGVGKSTQTERLVKQMAGVMCVSTGNLVRKLNKKVEAALPLNDVEKKAAESLNLMKQGKLMDDKPVYALLMAHLSPGGEGHDEYKRCHTIILDGVIKAKRAIEPFSSALRDFNQQQGNIPMTLKRVVNIAATEDELMMRQAERVRQTKEKGEPLRPDDNVDTYRMRVREYIENTSGLLDHYKSNNEFNYVDVDSSHGIEQTTINLMEAMNRETQIVEHRAGLGVA